MDLAISIHKDLKLTMYWSFKVILRDLKQNFGFQKPFMNSNYLNLMHGSFPPFHLDFSPSFLYSKKPKVQPLILRANILRGCLASKKKKIVKRKQKTRELCIFLSVKHNTRDTCLQEVISTPYIVFTKAKACDWLVTRIRKEITSQNTKENI